jgi:hypothetical protein
MSVETVASAAGTPPLLGVVGWNWGKKWQSHKFESHPIPNPFASAGRLLY